MAFGAPDWLASRWPVRSTMGTNQARYMITAAAAIAAGGTGILSIDVSNVYNLIISAITFTSPVSNINTMYIEIGGTIFYRGNWDMNGNFFFPQDAGPVVPAGVNVTIGMQNLDGSIQTLRVSVAGTYEEV